MRYAYCNAISANRAASLVGDGLGRIQSHAAVAVAVQVIFSFFEEEFDSSYMASARFQRVADGEEAGLAGKTSCFPAELA